MTHVWYVQYGDKAGLVDVSAVYDDVLAEIHKQDPNAYIEEIRLYNYQIAFYVNHPTWTEAKLAKEEAGFVAIVIAICLAIAAVLAAAGYAMNAYVNWEKEHRYYVDEDPETGEEVKIYGWSAYLAWLAGHRPDALSALKDYNASNWWEQIVEWIPIVVILIGAAIVVPLITKLIPRQG